MEEQYNVKITKYAFLQMMKIRDYKKKKKKKKINFTTLLK